MDDFRRAVNVDIGIGGWHCRCGLCGIAYKPKTRAVQKDALRRRGRHRLKNEDRQRIEEELSWTEEENAA